jgi:hypothetical protein
MMINMNKNIELALRFYGIPRERGHRAAVAAVCASRGAVPRVTGAAKAAAAGDDPSSPINGGPHPPFSP